MKNYKNFEIVECQKSNYIKPLRIKYDHGSETRIWDFIRSHDSVSIILYNVSRNVLIFVKQFRPAIYANVCGSSAVGDKLDPNQFDPKLGMAIELCAGIIDSDLTPKEIAVQEVREEVGYAISTSQLEHVATYRAGVGINGSNSHMYYCEVTDEMKKYPGGGTEQEDITVLEMKPSDAEALIKDDHVAKAAGLLLGILWFLRHKNKS